jgi:hypothetical protein
MISIHYPPQNFKIRSEENNQSIFDPLRKKWLSLTPEEWVRQNFVQYLVQVMKYPATLIALEKRIRLGELTKRFDILVYDREHAPWMIVECKGDEIKLNEEVLQQALLYNISSLLMVTQHLDGNGPGGLKSCLNFPSWYK